MDKEVIEIHTCDMCDGDIEHKKDEHGNVYWNGGHSAWPVADGRCCDNCHMTVMAARFGHTGERA